jgi:hypothetical protein
MLADKVTVTFDVVTVLLLVAVGLFMWACIARLKPRSWAVPLGLACFAGAFLAQHWGV